MKYFKRITCRLVGHKWLVRPSTIKFFHGGSWEAPCDCSRCGAKSYLSCRDGSTVKIQL
jgi:hypothetical protein